MGSASKGRLSNGSSSVRQRARPPARDVTSKPAFLSVCATRALESSLGHVQNNTSGRSRASFSTCSSNTSIGSRTEPGMV